jgi:hypothetical protein
MAEHEEVANQIVTSSIGAVLMKATQYGFVHEIHITDQKIYNGFPHMLRAVFEIPTDADDQAQQ